MEEVAPDRAGDTPDTLLAHHLASAPVPQGASPLVERVRWLQARVGWDDRHERLAEHPLLSGLRRSEIRRWAVAADEVEFDPGEMLLHEGRIGYWFFLVHTGSAVQTRRGRHVGEVMAGGHVGEIAILGCGPQPATVKANTPVRAFVVGSRHLLPLVEDMRPVQRRLFPGVADGEYAAHLATLRAKAAVDWAEIKRARAQARAHLGRLVSLEVRPGRPVQPRSLFVLALRTPLRDSPASEARRRRQPLSWRARAGIGLCVLAAVLGIGLRYHPPIAVVHPLPAIDVSHDITVSGYPVHPLHGRYLLLAVRTSRPNAFGALLAYARHLRTLPAGHDHSSRSIRPTTNGPDQELFRHSQLAAAAAAARAVGLDIHLDGDGAVVDDVSGRSGAGDLRAGDVIVAVDGTRVRTAPDVARLTAEHRSGSPLALRIERADERLALSLDPPPAPGTGFPVMLETRNPTFTLPFRVSFRRRAIGGPSGGLIFALALTDMLGHRDLALGRAIAATGTVEPGGTVGPVGFLPEKSRGARRAHAALLLVPAGEADQARAFGGWARGVLDLDDALRDLR